MNKAEEINRIRAEYLRRKREIPADFYSMENPGNRFIYESRLAHLREMMQAKGLLPLIGKKILEIGCGMGQWLADFKKWGAAEENFSGIDLDGERILAAKTLFPAAAFYEAEASQAPFRSTSFDIVLQSTVFSSILDEPLKIKIASEMMRVLKKGGTIVWYDFFCNNPWNSNVRGIGAEEISKLFPGCSINKQRITLAPPIARWLAPKSLSLSRTLERFGMLNTHYLALIRQD